MQLHLNAQKCKHFSKEEEEEKRHNKTNTTTADKPLSFFLCGQNKLYQCTTNSRGLHLHQSHITKAKNLKEDFKFFT